MHPLSLLLLVSLLCVVYSSAKHPENDDDRELNVFCYKENQGKDCEEVSNDKFRVVCAILKDIQQS